MPPTFAYGSNMNLAQMASRCPRVERFARSYVRAMRTGTRLFDLSAPYQDMPTRLPDGN